MDRANAETGKDIGGKRGDDCIACFYSASDGAWKSFPSLWWMVALFSLVGVGIGMMLPCLDALITGGIEKKERGTVTSFYSSLRFIGVAMGPPLAALLMKRETSMLLFLLVALCFLASAITFVAIKPEKEKVT